MEPVTLKTERLILRPWREDDFETFVEINADPVAMRHFPKTMTREDSRAMLDDRLRKHFADHGWGFWAIEIPGVAKLAGLLGLHHTNFDAHFTPAVEVGWRFGQPYWGKGYATEGAREALRFGFEDAKLDEIVSVTVLENKPSWSVMERCGMVRDPSEDFDHPRVPDGHRLKRHILYRLTRDQWKRLPASQRRGS